ncbi:MAG: FAD-dependent oxidoreductase [Pirellulales bacterium]
MAIRLGGMFEEDRIRRDMVNGEKSFDVIVIGLGGVGSATVAHLAANGFRVLGIDQFSPPHSNGSSHGQTRVIRKAYFEHPDYVPMLLRSYELWKQLELEASEQLYFPAGLLQIGPIDGEVLAGVRRSASEHRLQVNQMSLSQAKERYPTTWD